MAGTNSWIAEDLTDDSRAAFYAAARQRQEAAEAAERSNGRLWQIVGCAGLAIGVIGMGAAFDAIHRTPIQPPPGYVIMDKTTGWLSPPMTLARPDSRNQTWARHPLSC
jgi:hypothetical protein